MPNGLITMRWRMVTARSWAGWQQPISKNGWKSISRKPDADVWHSMIPPPAKRPPPGVTALIKKNTGLPSAITARSKSGNGWELNDVRYDTFKQISVCSVFILPFVFSETRGKRNNLLVCMNWIDYFNLSLHITRVKVSSAIITWCDCIWRFKNLTHR